MLTKYFHYPREFPHGPVNSPTLAPSGGNYCHHNSVLPVFDTINRTLRALGESWLLSACFWDFSMLRVSVIHSFLSTDGTLLIKSHVSFSSSYCSLWFPYFEAFYLLVVPFYKPYISIFLLHLLIPKEGNKKLLAVSLVDRDIFPILQLT